MSTEPIRDGEPQHSQEMREVGGEEDFTVERQESSLLLREGEGTDYTWRDLGYKVFIDDKANKTKYWKHLVRGFTGTARKGRTLAIMGPSGAGKTTFLNTVAGRILQNKEHVVEGVAFLNDTVFTNAYKKVLSFVAQDDIVMGKETPREALYFNYRMRLAEGHDAAVKATDEMLKHLHLTGCADTLLGVPGLLKGVSGGEKKRTNIGSELITNPPVLILDEPTTGLDSVNAYRVGQLLSELAHNEGRTVLCTIHTPSSELCTAFDDIMLLAKGRVAYHGPRDDAPAYFASLGHPLPPRYNPAEFFMNLLQSDDVDAVLDAWESHVATADEAKKNPCLHPGPMDGEIQSKDEPLLEHCKRQGCGPVGQMALLTARSWRLVRRDPISTVGRFVQTTFFALLLGLFYYKMENNSAGVQDRLGAIFMMAINSVFLALMNGVATFPPERAVFLMEQGNDSYAAWIYFLAKTVAELPFQLFFPILYSSITYFMLGFHESAEAFFVYMLIIVMTGNTAYSFGLLATAFFPSVEVAMAFIPLCLLPMMIVAGLFANDDRLDPYWLWMNYLSFPRYALTGVAMNEFERIGDLCPPIQLPDSNITVVPPCRYQNGQEVISYLGFEDESWQLSAGLLAVLTVGFRTLAAIALTVQGRNRRANLNFEANYVAPSSPSPRREQTPSRPAAAEPF